MGLRRDHDEITRSVGDRSKERMTLQLIGDGGVIAHGAGAADVVTLVIAGPTAIDVPGVHVTGNDFEFDEFWAWPLFHMTDELLEQKNQAA